jgi:hypothetical protein
VACISPNASEQTVHLLGRIAIEGAGTETHRDAYTRTMMRSLRAFAAIDQASKDARADWQRAQSRLTIDAAEQTIAAATSRTEITSALREAQRALSDARRTGGDRQARVREIRALEQKIDALKRDARDRERTIGEPETPLSASIPASPPWKEDHLSMWWLGVPSHLASKSASDADRDLGEGYAQVGRRPINSKFAGQRFPLQDRRPDLAEKYPESVEFTSQGFPDFSPYAIAKVELPYLGIDRAADFDLANEIRGAQQEADYVWHHVEDGKTMLLIPRDLHRAISHAGGIAHETNIVGVERVLTNYLLHSDNEEVND